MRRAIRTVRRIDGVKAFRPWPAVVSALAVLGFVLGAVHLAQHRLADDHADALACVQCSIAASAQKAAPAPLYAVAAPVDPLQVLAPLKAASPVFDGRPRTQRSRSPPDLRQSV